MLPPTIVGAILFAFATQTSSPFHPFAPIRPFNASPTDGAARRLAAEPERAERIYRELLAWTKEKLPAVRLVLLEPFTLPFGAGEHLAAEVRVRGAFTKKLAEEFGATFIPLQSLFDEACRTSKPQHWSADGVHLLPAGHQLVADAWLAAVKI